MEQISKTYFHIDGESLRLAIKEKGFSWGKFARGTGITPTYLVRIFEGRQQPSGNPLLVSPKIVSRFAESLGVNMEPMLTAIEITRDPVTESTPLRRTRVTPIWTLTNSLSLIARRLDDKADRYQADASRATDVRLLGANSRRSKNYRNLALSIRKALEYYQDQEQLIQEEFFYKPQD